MDRPKENSYRCEKCRILIVTVDVDDGVTSAFIECSEFGRKNCTGTMASSFYMMSEEMPKATYEWYRPRSAKEIREVDANALDHIQRGGLLIRKRTDAKPVYH